MNPTDVTPLREAAVSLHEAYTEFVHAGFTTEQALQLVIGMANGGMANGK